MKDNPLLVCDFDGVIVDGMSEYWNSAQNAFIKLCGKKSNFTSSTQKIPTSFKQLRPWVNHGWEMVLLSAEILEPHSSLTNQGIKAFTEDYTNKCNEVLKRWNWTPKQLQAALDEARNEAITNNQKSWLASHKAFPGVVERLSQLDNENVDFAVLTTKSADFAGKIMEWLQIKPTLLFGYESGKKSKVLCQLSKERLLKGFIEDRRATLETVLNTPQLKNLPCYLASWGYLKSEDHKNLPPGIHLLNQETLATPLASWP